MVQNKSASYSSIPAAPTNFPETAAIVNFLFSRPKIFYVSINMYICWVKSMCI